LCRAVIQIAVAALIGATAVTPADAQAQVKIVALGDSLTAGYGLPDKDGFVPQLQAALTAKGNPVEIQNAGVSGDTTSDGLARLDWSVPQGTDAVILELGANDMLRGVDPKLARANLEKMLAAIKAKGAAILLAGMKASGNYGDAYKARFDAIYPGLASALSLPLYPFFLEGLDKDAALLQSDGLHPSAEGVGRIVAGVAPSVEESLRDIMIDRDKKAQ
jgi:acyl-CoA thioesterase I